MIEKNILLLMTIWEIEELLSRCNDLQKVTLLSRLAKFKRILEKEGYYERNKRKN